MQVQPENQDQTIEPLPDQNVKDQITIIQTEPTPKICEDSSQTQENLVNVGDKMENSKNNREDKVIRSMNICQHHYKISLLATLIFGILIGAGVTVAIFLGMNDKVPISEKVGITDLETGSSSDPIEDYSAANSITYTHQNLSLTDYQFIPISKDKIDTKNCFKDPCLNEAALCEIINDPESDNYMIDCTCVTSRNDFDYIYGDKGSDKIDTGNRVSDRFQEQLVEKRRKIDGYVCSPYSYSDFFGRKR